MTIFSSDIYLDANNVDIEDEHLYPIITEVMRCLTYYNQHFSNISDHVISSVYNLFSSKCFLPKFD